MTHAIRPESVPAAFTIQPFKARRDPGPFEPTRDYTLRRADGRLAVARRAAGNRVRLVTNAVGMFGVPLILLGAGWLAHWLMVQP